jgi:hypothetical protein
MDAAAEAGIPDFWSLSKGELDRQLKGAAKRRLWWYELAAWHAWHVAALSRVDVKKFPTLEDMLRRVRPADPGTPTISAAAARTAEHRNALAVLAQRYGIPVRRKGDAGHSQRPA